MDHDKAEVDGDDGDEEEEEDEDDDDEDYDVDGAEDLEFYDTTLDREDAPEDEYSIFRSTLQGIHRSHLLISNLSSKNFFAYKIILMQLVRK